MLRQPVDVVWQLPSAVPKGEGVRTTATTQSLQEQDYRGLVAAVFITGAFGLIAYSMAAGREVPELFLGAVIAGFGAIIAWYFAK